MTAKGKQSISNVSTCTSTTRVASFFNEVKPGDKINDVLKTGFSMTSHFYTINKFIAMTVASVKR